MRYAFYIILMYLQDKFETWWYGEEYTNQELIERIEKVKVKYEH